MKRRSSSVDVGGNTSLELQDPDAEPEDGLNGLIARQSSTLDRQLRGLYSNSNQANGHQQHPPSHAAIASFSPLSLPTSSPSMTTTKQPPSAASGARGRGLWFLSLLCFFVATAGVGLLVAIFRSLTTRQIEPKGCRMSYMRPSYIHFSEFDTEHTRFASKYSLYLYREQGIDGGQLRGIPVLFIPGNAGSYKQVRPIAAETANYFHDYLQHDRDQLDSGIRSLDFFTVDFNEDITAFHGQTLLDQAEYLNEAVRYILSLYTEPQRGSRDSHLPDPTSVLILGHSMGGVVARAMLVQPNYQENSINTIITMSAPHARPPVTFDGRIVQIYDEINDYWRRAYTQKWASNNPLWHVTLVSIAGGNLDTVVPSDYASIESLVPETHGFTVFTSGIPTVWTSMDHQAILWCDQFRRVLAQTLYEIVDVHRASQTKPRAQRMRVFKKRLLTGLEPIAEKTLSLNEPTILLTLDDSSSTVVPTGVRLALSQLGSEAAPRAYLLPVPPHGSPEPKRFTLLTDAQLHAAIDGNQLQVLLCSVAGVNSILPSAIDLSRNGTTPTKLACKDAASDTVLLPASRTDIEAPFYLDGQPRIDPFSYLQYDAEHLSDHQFVAVIDRATSTRHGFVVAEFSDHSSFQKKEDIGLARLLTFGLSLRLPADRPLAMDVHIPVLKSSLIAYEMVINNQQCAGKRLLFAPLIRQYIQRPYESKFFVNARTTGISFHGVAPFMPPPLTSSVDDGLAFGVWSDPTCRGPLEIDLYVDVLGSLGKLYMRYRTVFAAFPLLIVTLVLRKQFSVYDTTGTFISFSEGLDLSLRRSIPLLLSCLTLLSLSPSRVTTFLAALVDSNQANSNLSSDLRFHKNDLLIGTDDPLFIYLVPFIGIVCVGVCTVLHYILLALTRILGVAYAIFTALPAINGNKPPNSLPVFAPSTPRRRVISTIILLFLVSTFIPYQFAYLVACLVQILTVVRALRIYVVNPSTANSNYYHYSHSILLLMMWVLPINLPILAVWVRNLAVHWLTPFSSHHNVLSIMPFILLVENLTTGKMVPQVTCGFRHITSGLLFGTALCAAIYGVSRAYMLHYLVNVVAGWLVILHSSTEPWSLMNFGMFLEGDAIELEEKQ
ncbi:PGAP1-domain-containing protein [Trichoderma citrinoviride]|uniref:GPI inositol-deacylase n=1 Tax=Trichoderma citrinoviride TaxID=58853 RepID=A0A2T4B401_9HYPO|nr:PGAP1-domain-containing protein [Trichoderma citrinoviride]PTB64042.1 PGAP1-domain-containing protein [Trichoderma citrinoviride]